MRAAGIPARVVTGYAGGYKNPYGDYWVLYQKDAHAWNEVWLDGEGWIRIDPTAAVAPENILDTLPAADGAESYFGERSLFSPLLDFGDFMTSRWNDWVIGFNAARQMDLLNGFGAGQLTTMAIAVGPAAAFGHAVLRDFLFWQQSEIIAIGSGRGRLARIDGRIVQIRHWQDGTRDCRRLRQALSLRTAVQRSIARSSRALQPMALWAHGNAEARRAMRLSRNC